MMVGCNIVSVVVCAVRSLGTHHDLYSSLVLFLYLCLLHGLRQILAGMVAEPAFLSEYTIFALDSSKQPKTQINSVVSPSTAFAFPCGEANIWVVVAASLVWFATYLPSERLQCGALTSL